MEDEVSSSGVLRAFLVVEVAVFAASTALEAVVDIVVAAEVGVSEEDLAEGKLYRSM